MPPRFVGKIDMESRVWRVYTRRQDHSATEAVKQGEGDVMRRQGRDVTRGKRAHGS